MTYKVHQFSLLSSASALAAGVLLLILSSAQAQELVGMKPDPDAEYSPYIQYDFPNQVLFGDTHLHTGYSADAGLVGATTTPDDAYQFAKGETVTSSNGVRARLQRPLDFLVVADHAENLGLTFGLEEGNESSLGTEWGKGLAEVIAPKTAEAMAEAYLYWAKTFSLGR